MEQDIELLLDICIEEMHKGKSIEECLAEYSQYASQLKPLLQLVKQIEDLPQPVPSPEAISSTLINIGKEIAQLTITSETPVVREKKRKTISFFNIFQKPKLMWAFNAALILIVVLFSVATISANSVPGNILYPVKLATEKVKFLLTFDSYKKAELRLTFSDKRLNEIIAVLQQSNTLDTTLLKVMLDEAKLALEENEIPSDKASIFAAKLSHVNAYQKDVLEKIRPRVNPSNRQIVDEAINMCDMRSRWMRKMTNEEYDSPPGESDSTPSKQLPHQSKQKSKKLQWGPGCDWMR